MHFKRRFAASVIVISGIVASCLGASAQVGSASTAPASVKLLVVTAAQQQQLRKLYAAYRHLPVSDVARIVPGSAREAVVTSTGQDWASIAFAPSAKASAALAIKFQDGAGAGIFTRAKGGNWKTAALGGEPLGCAARLPAAIRQAWHLAACPVTPPSPVGPHGPVTPESVTDQVGDIADDEIGVADNPAVTNFNGLDCNPYTAFEVSYASSSGCDTNARFDITNKSEFWCADFAKWVWAQAGVTSDLSVLTPSAASFYTWGKDHGESMAEDATNPAAGDAVVFYPGTSPNGTYADHVGIVTAVNSNGTVNLVNGDFLGSTNISVQVDDNVSLKSWSASIWGSGEDWAFVSPQLATPGHAADELVGTQSGKCVDTNQVKFADGTKEQIYTCNGGSGQEWTYNSSGQFTVDGGKYCLDVVGQGTANGTKVDLWACNGGANQQWSFGPSGSMVSIQSGKCLNVSQASTANGAQLLIWTCGGQANEKFTW